MSFGKHVQKNLLEYSKKNCLIIQWIKQGVDFSLFKSRSKKGGIVMEAAYWVMLQCPY